MFDIRLTNNRNDENPGIPGLSYFQHIWDFSR